MVTFLIDYFRQNTSKCYHAGETEKKTYRVYVNRTSTDGPCLCGQAGLRAGGTWRRSTTPYGAPTPVEEEVVDVHEPSPFSEAA